MSRPQAQVNQTRGRVAHGDIATLGLVAIGAALLLVRVWLPTLGSLGHLTALTVTLLAILVASLLVPAVRSSARLHPGVMLTVGLAAVALALLTGGRPMPAPLIAWALPLTLLAAVAEEALFRRAMYGALERRGTLVAIGATALAFALVHVPIYGVAVFPVDLGAGLLLSWQRWAAGSWTVPAATHAAANVVMTVLR